MYPHLPPPPLRILSARMGCEPWTHRPSVIKVDSFVGIDIISEIMSRLQD